MKYTAPEMEIVMFEADEVIVASGDPVTPELPVNPDTPDSDDI